MAPAGTQSWMKGDFNLNGITDLPDVYFMHEALVDAGLGSFSPFGGQLPEPTTGVLLAWCAAACLGRRRKLRVCVPGQATLKQNVKTRNSH